MKILDDSSAVPSAAIKLSLTHSKSLHTAPIKMLTTSTIKKLVYVTSKTPNSFSYIKWWEGTFLFFFFFSVLPSYFYGGKRNSLHVNCSTRMNYSVWRAAWVSVYCFMESDTSEIAAHHSWRKKCLDLRGGLLLSVGLAELNNRAASCYPKAYIVSLFG